MNDMTPATADLRLFLVEQMHIAPENPRSDEDVDAAVIEDLADNIEEHGLLTPLIGFLHNEQAFLTAGGRRLRALRLIETRNGPFSGLAWPVRIMDRQGAIDAGNAEQLTHVAMSELDELRVYALPAYANMADAKLARITGRSTLYVQQRRAILALPQNMLDAVFDRSITLDQGIGLTYANDDDQRADFYRAAKSHRYFDSAAMRRQAFATVQPWSRVIGNPLVTREEYEAEGGRLQADLFTGDPIVFDPGVLMSIAMDKAKTALREKFPLAAFISEKPETVYAFSILSHPGISALTAAEREAHAALKAEYDTLSGDEDSIDPETDDYTEAVAARIAELEEQMQVYAEKSRDTVYPDELAQLLGVYVWLQSTDEGYGFKANCLSDDLGPLVEGGWVTAPAAKTNAASPAGEADAPPPVESVSGALAVRIEKIKAHALRMDLIRNADNVIALYVAHITNRLGYTAGFHSVPLYHEHPDDNLNCQPSKAWSDIEALINTVEGNRDAIMALKPAQQRQILAQRMLLCLANANPMCKQVAAKTVRAVWTPDADFLKAYSRPQLAAMAEGLHPGHYADQKKGALVELVASLAAKEKEWLPIGFPAPRMY